VIALGVRPTADEEPAGWRTVWTAPRARLWLLAAAVAAWLPLIGVPLRRWLDFSAFSVAGSLAFNPQVAQLAPVLRAEVERGLPPTPFVYPADVALAYVPFSWLPYDLSAALHVALMAALLIVAAAWGADLLRLPRRWAVLGALAWGPAVAGVVSGQNTPLALLLVVASGFGMLRHRDGITGFAAGILAYKPQLAAPVLGLLLLRGRWRSVGVAGLVILGQYLLGVVAAGGNWAWPVDWVATLGQYTAADFHDNGWQAISLPALGTHLELVMGIHGLTLVGYAIAGLAVIACVPALRRMPPLEALALTCALGLLISPHAWVYDATLLLPAMGVLAARASQGGWPWQARWLFALAWAIGLTWALGGFVGVTLVPVLVVAVPVALIRWWPAQHSTTSSRPGSLEAATAA
jgi:Glycosyltransferase family 87